ncbi:SGNH/GDSL hydrolase family protein [Planococcus sp. ISL-109]|uniref:SGNH/GDSL hydrolase family protein n=1 Tax=Planococcus sp. ISL-109 TaxID=2819166 RepID=UPI001BE4E756|nr:SGNH/GDSL hydrolase family protein [Planococcus sp. ISL-109]MBT2584095.1 SGNH/GDSL hydrolase family protein [Planococcus sp. ISL-109]
MKKTASMLLAGLILTGSASAASAELQVPAVYVAIGDSLAAGQTPDRAIDSGYTDLIAQELTRNQPVALYSKDLAFPGFTAAEVLDSIQSDEAAELLASANIVTVSAGANDLLRLVQPNAAEGSLNYEQIQADYALNAARENVGKILADLSDSAPSADVYVMGYYFAYPHARDSQKQGTAKQLDQLNAILEQEAERAGATFVGVSERFGEEAVELVPNAGDVHPNVNGYQEMANAFFEQYSEGSTVEDAELPPLAPMSFEEIQQTQEDSSSEEPEQTQQPEQDAQDESADNDAAARPTERTPHDYLAIRQALPFV